MTPLSAKALQIDPAEHKALLEVRDLFVAGTFHHDKDLDLEKPNGFNMNFMLEEGDCGTTACIGGWMFLAMQRDRTAPCARAYDYVQKYRSDRLAPLFAPFTDGLGCWIDPSYDFPYELMPPAFALTAIDNFLTTGEPQWDRVCGLHNIEVPRNDRPIPLRVLHSLA